MSGLLNFGNPKYGAGGPEGTLLDPIANLKRKKMEYTLYETGEKIMEAFPCFKNLPSSYQGVFAPDNGSINVPLVLRALKRLAEGNGAELISQCKVTNFAVKPSNVEVGYDYYGETGTITAGKAIIASGAYTNDILKPLNI